MRWDLSLDGVSWLGVLDVAKREDLAIVLAVEVMSVLVDTLDIELAAKALDVGARLKLITGPVAVTHVLEAWLSNNE